MGRPAAERTAQKKIGGPKLAEVAGVRAIAADELDSLAEGARAYFAEAGDHGSFKGGFDERAFAATWGGIIRTGHGRVWGSFDRDGRITGALSGLKQVDLCNGDLIAAVVFWYLIPEYRGSRDCLRLFRSFEAWAVEIGAKRLAVGHLARLMPRSFEKFYRRLGYELNEMHYMKELQ